MSVLATAFQARYPSQRVVEWTNFGVPSATSVNSTILELAVTDASADFPTFTATDFDSTNAAGLLAQQTPVAIVGVAAYLKSYSDQGAGDKAIAEYHRRLVELAKVTGRDRVLPRSSSGLTPSPVPRIPGSVQRPDFDDSIFDGQALSPPSQHGGTGGLDDWDDGSL